MQTVDVGPVPDASVMRLVSYVSRRYADPITYEAVWNESDHCIAQAEKITELLTLYYSSSDPSLLCSPVAQEMR